MEAANGQTTLTANLIDGLPQEIALKMNNPPVFTADPISKANATEDAAYTGQTLAGSATDVDAEATLSYAKDAGPAWLRIAADGTRYGTPGNSDVGENNFTVQVTDGISSVTTSLQITVQPVPPSSYTLAYIAGANGSLGGTTPQTINSSASGTAVTAVALTGYRFLNWSDGSTANPRTDANVTSDLTVTANFAVIPGYTGWFAAFPSIAASTPETDSDNDGMANLMEYALGGNPIIRDATTVLPKVQATPSGVQFTLYRSETSKVDTGMTFQYTDELSNQAAWIDVAIGATSSGPDPSGVEVTVEDNGSDSDFIRITMPVGFKGRIFGRIRASSTP